MQAHKLLNEYFAVHLQLINQVSYCETTVYYDYRCSWYFLLALRNKTARIPSMKILHLFDLGYCRLNAITE